MLKENVLAAKVTVHARAVAAAVIAVVLACGLIHIPAAGAAQRDPGPASASTGPNWPDLHRAHRICLARSWTYGESLVQVERRLGWDPRSAWRRAEWALTRWAAWHGGAPPTIWAPLSGRIFYAGCK